MRESKRGKGEGGEEEGEERKGGGGEGVREMER